MRIKDECLEKVLAGKAHLLFDGAMGSMLARHGVSLDGKLELLNFQQPALIEGIHRSYVEAGAQVITTNTFCAHERYLAGDATPEDVFQAAVALARAAGARYVAADMGPLREFVEPLGPLSPEEAYTLYARQARAAQTAGADLVVVETQFDITEAEIAVRAVRDNADLPVFATLAFSSNGCTMFGSEPAQAARTLVAAGAHAVGANCAVGPADMAPLVAAMHQAVPGVPLVAQANAGVPDTSSGQAVYPVGPAQYAADAPLLVDAGATILGGCCGTTPEYIALLAEFAGFSN